MIKDCNVDPFVRWEAWSATPIADSDVGADSIHQLTSGTFYKEKLAALNLFSHVIAILMSFRYTYIVQCLRQVRPCNPATFLLFCGRLSISQRLVKTLPRLTVKKG